MLGVPFIPQIGYVDHENGSWTVTQITAQGKRELEFSGPGVLSITSIPENVPRIPAVRAIFAAKKKPVIKLDSTDQEKMALNELEVTIPKVECVCEFIDVEDPGQAARILLNRLNEERYL
jgi:electron transfer flavoprotein beta subunit